MTAAKMLADNFAPPPVNKPDYSKLQVAVAAAALAQPAPSRATLLSADPPGPTPQPAPTVAAGPFAEGRLPNKDEAFYYGLFKTWPKPSWIPAWLRYSMIAAAVVGIISAGYFLARKVAG